MTHEEHDTTMMLALTSQPDLHLQDCLDNYFQGCEVDIKCERCNQPEKATITRRIVRRPRCLILNLLRYYTDNTDTKKKMDKVTIPQFISIGDFCTDDAKPPLYTAPAFLTERVIQETIGSDLFSPGKDSASSDQSKSSTNQTLSGSREKSPEQTLDSTESCSETTTSVIKTTQDISSASDSAARLDSDVCSSSLDHQYNTTPEDDSVFGQDENSTDPAGSSFTSENISNTLPPDAVLKENEFEKDGSDGNNEEQDNVVTFPKLCPQKIRERVKCRGGSVKDLVNSSSILVSEVFEDSEVIGVKKQEEEFEGCGQLDGFVAVGEATRVRRRGRVDDDDNNDDIIENGNDDDDNNGNINKRPSKVLFVEEVEEVKDNNKKEDFCDLEPSLKRKSCSEDADDVDGIGELSGFSQSSELMEGGFKEPDDLSASIGEDALMDLEDMASQMLCGRNVHEYSEFELQSLDIGALTEYETLLFAQALSRMEYAKESEARGRGVSATAAMMMANDISGHQLRAADEFMCDRELLEEAELMFCEERTTSSTSTTRRHGNPRMVEVSSSPMKREEESCAMWQYRDESESGSLSTKLSSDMTTESAGSELSDSYGSNQKVPDISEAAENMNSTGLFCEENLSEDGVVELRGLKVLSDDFQSSGKRGDASKSSVLASDRCLFCGQILMGCDCVHCTTGAKDFGVDSLDESVSTESSKSVDVISAKEEGVRDVFVSPGILSDKKNQPKVAAVTRVATFTKEESDNLQISSKKPVPREQESPKPQQKTTYLSKTNSNSAVAKTSLPPPCSSPSPQKVPLDVFMVSPSKNRNLVKTRDYSRLRSPSASPKKKLAKASPLKKGSASKQLMFPDEAKSPHRRRVFSNSSASSLKDEAQCHQQHTPQKSTPPNSTTGSSSTGSTHIAPSWSQNKQSKNVSFGSDRKDAMTSRALQFGEEDEPDSMDTSKVTAGGGAGGLHPHPHNNQFSEEDRIPAFPPPSSPFHAINTSTPITASSHGNACNTNNNSNTPGAHQGPLLSDPSCSSSSNHKAKSSTATTSKTLNRDASSDVENSPDNENPLRDCQSQRRKAGRCLANSFSAADKENSIVVSQAKQARGKRISQIEQGEAGCSYRLVGIVNHHGESLFAGHYTCSTYNLSKQQWYHMDDKHTQETTESAVRRDSSSTGYVFFYMDKELFESYATRKSSSSSSS